MKYIDCPTCGGKAKFVSDNFEKAGIMISTEHDIHKENVNKLVKEIVMLTKVAEEKLDEISSDELFELYKLKLHKEARDKTEWEERFYGFTGTTTFKDFNWGL